MEPYINSNSELYRPSLGAAESQRFDRDTTTTTVRRESLGGAQGKCTSSVQAMDGAQLVGGAVMQVGGGNPPSTVAAGVNTSVAAVIGPEKRKRGRPPRGLTAAKPPPPKRKVEEEEEDVCFICFDGGSLVLCDRKGCPKAYHPACIKRDEAFFRSKAKWNCGWHICSVCQKASHYMCYTCTYSLCKGCITNADYFSVRGNKGFCSTCMRTIMLIENKDEANKEMVQVDFDDKTSWEYLFKVYWMYLKGKLSLTLNELIQAKNPWKEAVAAQRNLQVANANDCKSVIGKSSEQIEVKNHKEREEIAKKDSLSSENQSTAKSENAGIAISNEHLGLMDPNVPPNKDKLGSANGSAMKGYTEWATKELLEFVAHMKNGDISALSQFDVQALLLDYIKRNNLRDPHKKSQIICDLRLKNLFGKPRLGHIEMLKLIEFHFLIKEDTQKNAFIPAGIVGDISSHLETDESSINPSLINKNKKRKTCKKGEEKAPQVSLDEYAAIDAHNINLIYLRRSLMENLMEDTQKFHDDVVGSIVRIKITGSDQKQDMYRLVHVVGTSKVSTPYKIGEKTTDIMLEVLNLDKKEAVAIDTLSNQEFSEDECRRLRQSIKCGLVKRMTVGEIQKKAMALRPVKLNESLESEILRLNHLRDRASENGRKKDLRECIEKLQCLKTPEERRRRMLEIPEVHTDPKMNPNYESEEDAGGSEDKKQDENLTQRNPRLNKSGSKQIPTPMKKVKLEGAVIALMAQNKPNEKRQTSGVHTSGKRGNQTSVCGSVISGQVDKSVVRCGSETSVASLSTENSAPSSDDSETEKLWHYRDPSGHIQGPFSMMQLRRWNKRGLFPPDMRVWIGDKHNESILLSDALHGQFHKASQILDNATIKDEGLEVALDSRGHAGWHGSSNGTVRENEGHHSDDKVHPNAVRTDELKPRSLLQCLNLLKENNSCSDKPQECNMMHSSSDGQVHLGLAQQERGHDSGGLHTDTDQGNQKLYGNTMSQPTDMASHEMQYNMQSVMGQLFGSLPVTNSENTDSGTHLESVTKSSDSPDQNGKINVSDLPSPTPKSNYDSWEFQAAKELLSLSSDIPLHRSGIQDMPSPPPKANNDNQCGQTTETKEHLPSNIPVQDSGPSPNTSLVVDGVQLPEVTEWGGNSPTPKPPVEDWDPGLVSVSSLKPPEVLGDQVATPASNADQLTHSSPPSNVIEFSTLAEESVSDLLAEVDAMESQAQSGLGSPTSAMRCSVDLMQWSKSDFSSIEEMSPALGPAKSDAYSSTGDIQLPCQSPVTNELVRGGQTDGFDPSKRCNGHSSTSSEGETKSTDVSFSKGHSGSEVRPHVPCTVSQNTVVSAMDQSRGSEAMVTAWGTTQGNANYGAPQSVQGYANPGPGTSSKPAWRNPNTNRSAFNGNPAWDSQRRHAAERFPGPRDWAFQGGYSGHGRSRPAWNRQSFSSGGGSGGGHSRPPPKARVCKFYESGRCKKGASCDYLHP
nr:zinc finger CCCH domain-containing protein 44-like [Ipomoea batatas]